MKTYKSKIVLQVKRVAVQVKELRCHTCNSRIREGYLCLRCRVKRS